MRIKNFIPLVFSFLLFSLSAEELVSINFSDVDISVVARFVSQVTGKNFLLSDQVRGKVTVISPTKIPRDEVYKVFESILEIKGLTAIPSGKVIKIVPAREARQYPLPVNIGKKAEEIGEEDKMVTQLVPLEYADVQQVSSILSSLVSPEGHITSYPPTNTLILSDYASNIRRLLRIVDRIDQPQAKMVTEIIPLQYASATQLSQAISQVLETIQGKTGSVSRTRIRTVRRTTPTLSYTPPPPRIIPDERTNSLVVVASLQDMKRIKKLVEKLDVPAPRGKERMQVYYLQNADAEELAKVLTTTPLLKTRGTLKEAGRREISIVADKATNSLIISASPQDYEELVKVIEKLDIPRPQVLVEALIADVSMEKLRELGIEWATVRKEEGSIQVGGGTKFKVDYTNPEASLSLMNGLLIGYLKGEILGGLLQAYGKDTGFKVLSTPHLLTLDNEEAKIVVGKNVPFVTSSRITEQETVVRSYEYRDVGIILTLTPHINKEGMVRLKIHQEVTNLSPEALQAEAPVTNKREAETTVTVADKSTVVIGGLIRNDRTEVLSKVPLLGDIPLLGYFFRRRETTVEKRNLLIFITPHIIRTPQEAENIRKKKEEEMKKFSRENAPS